MEEKSAEVELDAGCVITVASEAGKGTTFTVILPARVKGPETS
jgi:signal transduction histidine kinase